MVGWDIILSKSIWGIPKVRNDTHHMSNPEKLHISQYTDDEEDGCW
jgi:hypothetical protein